jgi:HSP20 family protein
MKNVLINDLMSIPRFFEEIMFTSFTPALDVVEDQNQWTVRLDVPGMTQKDIRIQVDGELLVIEGERKREETQNTCVHVSERRWGHFRRTIGVPSTVDPSRASASCKDGVLTVTLPRREEAKRRSINIEIK